MKSITTICFALLAFFAKAQDADGFTQTDRGTKYKIVASGSGDRLSYGSFFEFSYQMRYKAPGKDSLLNSSEMTSNSIALLDTVSTPIYIYNIFTQCRNGDSVVMQVSIDSAFAGGQIPPGFSKEGYFSSGYRIVNVFASKEEADSVFKALTAQAQAKAEAKARQQVAVDDAIIVDYLAKNGINAVKAPLGTYVEIKVPGKGKPINDQVEVQINYTGRTLAGKAFDSNTDPAFGHVEPFSLKMWEPNVIQGWIEGLPYFSLGAKGRLYIPSGLAYGAQGAGADIGPNENLIFDIEITKVTPKPLPPAPKPLKKAPAKKPAAKKPVKKVVKKK